MSSDSPAKLGRAARSQDSRYDGLGLVRAVNEQVVLETVFREGQISRAGIARVTRLSKPTVSSIVGELEACGLVKSRGQSSGNVGRPSTLYEVNATAGFVFAMDLGGTKIRAGIGDIYGDIVAETTEPTVQGSGEDLLGQVDMVFRGLVEEAKLDESEVRAAGIGIPGVFDPTQDLVSAAPNVPGLEELRVVEELVGVLRIPVVVDNDVNLAAAGERWRGLATEQDNFVAISIGTGIGMGIVIGGEIYRGAYGAAGEIDFLPLGGDRSPDTAGHGPFESASSGPAMLEEFAKRVEDGAESKADPREGVAGIFAAAAAGDRVAADIVGREARRVATAIAAVCAVLDPQLVVLGGGVGANPYLLAPVRRHLAEIFPRVPRIETSALGDRAAFYGAMAVGLRVARQVLLAEMSGGR